MSLEWWKAFAIFALAMLALSFISVDAAVFLTLAIGAAAILSRIGKQKGTT